MSGERNKIKLHLLKKLFFGNVFHRNNAANVCFRCFCYLSCGYCNKTLFAVFSRESGVFAAKHYFVGFYGNGWAVLVALYFAHTIKDFNETVDFLAYHLTGSIPANLFGGDVEGDDVLVCVRCNDCVRNARKYDFEFFFFYFEQFFSRQLVHAFILSWRRTKKLSKESLSVPIVTLIGAMGLTCTILQLLFLRVNICGGPDGD